MNPIAKIKLTSKIAVLSREIMRFKNKNKSTAIKRFRLNLELPNIEYVAPIIPNIRIIPYAFLLVKKDAIW